VVTTTGTITVNPTPTVTVPSNIVICNGGAIATTAFASAPTSGTFTWTNSNTAIGLAASGTGNIIGFNATNTTAAAISATIIVTPTVNGCPGTPNSYTITVNPTPTVSVSSPSPVCTGIFIAASNFASLPSGGTFTWSNSNTAIGLGASGIGNVPAFTTTNTGSTAISGIITVTPTANGCPGTASNYTITVNPIPTVSVPTPIVVCNNDSIPTTAFASTPAGGSFTWTNSDTTIGLGASGIGNIPAFNAINTGIAAVTSTVTVTPTVNSCAGTAKTYTITVNPTPALIISCGTPSPNSVTFNWNAIAGVTSYNYSYSVNGGAAVTGSLPSTTTTLVVDSGVAPNQNVTATITPIGNSCVVAATWNCTSDPCASPTVDAVSPIISCANQLIPSTVFASTPTGGNFAWTNTNPAIGLAASGTGNLPAFTPINTGTTPITATISVTANNTICTGPATTFTITINPIPTVSVPLDSTVCNGDLVPAAPFVSVPLGGTFAWTNSNSAIGLAATGTGNIAAFTGTNSGAAAISGTIIVTPTVNGCVGTTNSYKVTVNPTPTVSVPSNIIVCNGGAIATTAFASTPAAGTFTWINSNTAIGLAASGTGNIIGFNAVNTTAAAISANIIVTPTVNGCPGTPNSYTITVNPTPTVTVPTAIVVCNGGAVSATAFASTPAGGTFTWTNSNTAVGLAASGTGDIATFNATNSGATAINTIITVIPTVNSCPGTSNTYTITVNPTPTVTVPSNKVFCNGDSVPTATFTSLPTGGTYTWTNDTPAIGLAASGTGSIAGFNAVNTGTTPLVATITVTPTVNSCPGTSSSYTITVNPTPALIISCGTPSPTSVTFNWNAIAGATSYNYSYAVNNGAAVTGSLTSATTTLAINSGINPGENVSITITPIGNACAVPATWNCTASTCPTPLVNPITSITTCTNILLPATTFTSPTAGVTYAWTNTNPAIGLAASGTGNLPAFTTINTGATPITATISVTANDGVCTGPQMTFTITVNPIPTVSVPSNATVCNGTIIPAAAFVSVPTGGNFTWTNTNPAIGLVASGTGNIASFTATNSGATAITASITVTPTVNSCLGTSSNYTITVNPTPTVTVPAPIVVCNGTAIAAASFVSVPLGGTFTWTNSNTAIGLAASGTGNAPAFTAVNTGITPITATITVTPTLSGCPGIVSTYTITVNPTPKVSVPSNLIVCSGTAIAATAFASTPAGGTFTWTNSNTAIGLAASGTGDIASFTAANPGLTPITASITVVPTANGCPGIASTYTITVNPTSTAVATPSLETICSLQSTGILLTSPILGTTFSWTAAQTATTGATSGNGTIISQVLTATGATLGNVTYTIIPTYNGCAGAPITASVSVAPKPTVIATPSLQTICSTSAPNVILSSNIAGTVFNWNVVQTNVTGASAGSGNTINQILTTVGNRTGEAVYSVVPSLNGCQGTPILVTITVNPIPVATANPSLATICSGTATSIALTSNVAGATFSWAAIQSGVIGATSGIGNTIAQTLSTAGIVPGSVTYTISPIINGCAGLPITATVTVNPTPEVFGSAGTTICSGESSSILLSPNIPGTQFAWTVVQTNVLGAADGTGDTIDQILEAGSVVGTAVYTVTPSLNGCSGKSIKITINVNPAPAPAIAPGIICVDAAGTTLQTYTLDTNLSTTNYTFEWYWNSALINGAVGSTYDATKEGNYSVIVTNKITGCVSKEVFTTIIANNPATSLDAVVSDAFTQEATITASVQGGTGPFLYQIDGGEFQSSNEFTGLSSGTHTLTVKDVQGCTNLSIPVIVIDYPKYFTPNGDGYDDTWNIKGLNDQPNARIFIFDRYGKLLKEISTIGNGWDGTFNSKQLPATDYWFTVEYVENNLNKLFKAHFSLKR
jgi:gliding motility-associated-like protein